MVKILTRDGHHRADENGSVVPPIRYSTRFNMETLFMASLKDYETANLCPENLSRMRGFAKMQGWMSKREVD